MTRITEIAAPNIVKNRGSIPPLKSQTSMERKQRGELLTERSFIDTVNLSEGQMSVTLWAEYYRILSEYYPEDASYLQGYQIAKDALYKGLHTANGISYFSSLLNPKLNPVVNAINKAKSQTKNASGFFTSKEKPNAANIIGDPIVPIRDCLVEFPIVSLSNLSTGNLNAAQVAVIRNEFPSINPPDLFTGNLSSQQIQDIISRINSKRDDCNKENIWRDLFNTHFEEMAHHPLYNFMTNSQLSKVEPVFKYKQGAHVQAIGSLSVHSKISNSLLRQWQELGIVRHNAIEGAGPLNANETIFGLMDGKVYRENGEYIGEPLTIAAVTAIIIAIGSALSAATLFINSLRQKQPTPAQLFEQQIPTWKDPSFSSDPDDFVFEFLDVDNDGTVTNAEAASGLIPLALALGAGVYLIFTPSNSTS